MKIVLFTNSSPNASRRTATIIGTIIWESRMIWSGGSEKLTESVIKLLKAEK